MSFESTERPVPKLFAVASLRIASFARADAPIEEPALHWVTRQSERCSEVLARGLVPPASKLELAKRRGVEGICGEAIAVAN